MKTIACMAVIGCGLLRAQMLTPVWVELGEGRQAFARVVVRAASDCPAARIDGVNRPMRLREPVPDRMRPVCETPIPAGTRSATVNGQALALPHRNPSRIVVIGDTGCRIKGDAIQDCSDPAKWPFQSVASEAAGTKPDLAIHVGDFVYREDKCPDKLRGMCGSTPPGDRWEAWDADFFTPAAKLLAAAPWLFARGNHENCARSWRGWFYYLDPHPWSGGACQEYPPVYVADLGNLKLAMLDSSAAFDVELNEKQIGQYASQLRSIHETHAWIVDHDPFWGLRAPLHAGPPDGLTAPMAAAWDRASPQGIDLIVSGHIHLFELLSFDHNHPPQLIAGDAGTELAPAIPEAEDGARIFRGSVVNGRSEHKFGYTLLTKTNRGWNLTLESPGDEALLKCSIEGKRVMCNSATERNK
jgi:hypothetical protein